MNFSFSDDENSWRGELHSFFMEQLPPDFTGEFDEGSDEAWASLAH